MNALARRFEHLETALYNLTPYYGFLKDVAHHTGFQRTALRQAINPNYADRPSFITRTASVFIAWIVLHPNSGMQALWQFVMFILEHAPTENMQSQILLIEDHVVRVKEKFEDVQAALDAIPKVRLDCREMVSKRKEKGN